MRFTTRLDWEEGSFLKEEIESESERNKNLMINLLRFFGVIVSRRRWKMILGLEGARCCRKPDLVSTAQATTTRFPEFIVSSLFIFVPRQHF